jgi:hypothetical protein
MSGEINVLSRTQKIVVNPTTRSVAVINAGPPGTGSIGIPPGGDPGQVLTKDTVVSYDTSWQDPPDPPASKLDDLTDVKITGIPTNGQVLKYDGAQSLWVPGVDESGGAGGGLPPGGVIYDLLVKASSTDGHAAWTSAPQTASVVTNLINIRDVVGAQYPVLTFGSGDGNNGTNPNPYQYSWQLLGDKLQLFSSRNVTDQLAMFRRTAATKVEFGLGDWYLEADATDNYLRFFKGADRLAAEAYIASNGGFGCNSLAVATTATIAGALTVPGGVFSQWYTETPILQAAAGTALLLRSSTYSEIQAGGGFGSPTIGVSVGNQYGVGAGPTVSLFAFPNGNQYYQRQLTLNKIGGAGECGMSFINNVTGNIGCFQLHNDGTPYIGFLNAANSGYIKSYASAFTISSGRRFKSELQRFGSDCRYVAMDIIKQVVPVRYRDLQHEMAANILAPTPDGVARKPVVVEPNYRFGLIAEEVEESAPELVSHTPDHGPGIDLSGLIGVLWQAVRELSDELQGVRQELADIRGYPQ